MNILVIGNGFDIAHGLPTKYGQFLSFMKDFMHYFDDETAAIKDEIKHKIDVFKTEEQSLYEEIPTLIADNKLMSYFWNKHEDLIKQGKENWIDFETEISTIIQALDSARLVFSNQYKNGKQSFYMEKWQTDILYPVMFPGLNLKNATYKFSSESIEKIKLKLLNDLNRLTRCLEIYLCCFIDLNFDVATKPLFESLEIDKAISFNYTNTYSLLYGSMFVDCDYIHGKAYKNHSIEENNMVLGIEEYLSGDSKDLDNEFIQFKKFYQRIVKMNGKNYKNWFEKIARENNPDFTIEPKMSNIYIYGHSMDPTDSDILRDLLLNENAKIFIYYYNKDALSDLVINLVKVIGEDELIKLTDSATGRIKFVAG